MDFLTIFNYELKSLAKSAKSTIFSLAFTSFFWGIFFSLNIFTDARKEFLLVWLLFFAFLASAGFAGVSFVRERLSGSWEILIASGISRKTIFVAKFIFVQSASFLWGTLTLLIAYLSAFYVWNFYVEISLPFVFAIFFFASFSINAITAYLTIINVNPRAIQLINFAIMSVLSTTIYFIDYEQIFGKLAIIFIILVPSVFVFFLVPKALYDDKIVQKIIY
ncbi:MAG: ABC transporter permease [Chitinivibrionia bacterium]|nr:ABC transporter permease [Chitinivibrionia bacterium]